MLIDYADNGIADTNMHHFVGTPGKKKACDQSIFNRVSFQSATKCIIHIATCKLDTFHNLVGP